MQTPGSVPTGLSAQVGAFPRRGALPPWYSAPITNTARTPCSCYSPHVLNLLVSAGQGLWIYSPEKTPSVSHRLEVGVGRLSPPVRVGQAVTGPLRLPLRAPLPALLWAGLWAVLCRWRHRSLGFGLHQCDLGTCFPTARLWLVLFTLLFSSFL